MAESTPESLKRLADVNPYFWPGPPIHEFVMLPENPVPLAADKGGDDLEAIMSNRRFRKVVDDLSQKDEADASRLIKDELAIALNEYQQLYAGFATIKDSMMSDDGTLRSGPSLERIVQTPDGKTVMTGARLKVLALVWIAGLLELDDCGTQIGQVVETALGQRNSLYEHPNWSPIFRADMVEKISLFNRQILGTGLVGTSADTQAADKAVLQAGVSWAKRELVSYRASRTEYDYTVVRDGFNPDRSQGSRIFRFLSPMSDEQFDALRAELK